MKKLFIIYVIAASIGFSSCTGLFGEGQLDMAPVEDINEDKIFSDYAMFRQYADHFIWSFGTPLELFGFVDG